MLTHSLMHKISLGIMKLKRVLSIATKMKGNCLLSSSKQNDLHRVRQTQIPKDHWNIFVKAQWHSWQNNTGVSPLLPNLSTTNKDNRYDNPVNSIESPSVFVSNKQCTHNSGTSTLTLIPSVSTIPSTTLVPQTNPCPSAMYTFPIWEIWWDEMNNIHTWGSSPLTRIRKALTSSME